MEKKLIKAVSSVKSSNYRYNILKALLNGILTPSEIITITNFQQSNVSKFLQELKELNLAICLNDDDKRGRLYQITDLGKKTLKFIEGNSNEGKRK